MTFKSFVLCNNTLYYSSLCITDLEFYLGTSNCPRGKLIYKGTYNEGHYLGYGTYLTDKVLNTLKEILGKTISYEVTLETTDNQEFNNVIQVPNHNIQSNTFYKEKL